MQEHIYPPNKFSSSPLIDLNYFLLNNEICDILPSYPFERKPKQSVRMKEIKNLMDSKMDDTNFQTLETYCSVEELNETSQGDEDINKNPLRGGARHTYKPIPITDEARKFKTVERLEKRIKEDSVYAYKLNLKYPADDCSLNNEVKTNTVTPDLVPGKDLLIKIRVYRTVYSTTGIRAPKPKFIYDIVVLGSHTLDVLRDKITCPNEYRALGDISENPNQEEIAFLKEKYKSGFLFIEDVFYNDNRNKDNIDYSKTIIDWASTKNSFGTFKTAFMENTTFKELKIHLGYPQLYQHMGNCEHIFVFSDVEILQPSDLCSSLLYPHSKTLSTSKAIYCNFCGRFVAKWVVEQNERVPFDPAFFCDSCFHSYNYIEGKKIGKFKAYPYYNRRCIA